MILLMTAFLFTTAQETVPQATDEAPKTVTAAAAPEKICKRRTKPSGEGGIKGFHRYKVCKTKEEWEQAKSSRD